MITRIAGHDVHWEFDKEEIAALSIRSIEDIRDRLDEDKISGILWQSHQGIQIAGSWYIIDWKNAAGELYEILKEPVPVGRYPEYPEYMKRKEDTITAYENAINGTIK